ncbi:hypothetical protein [Clostridium tagluense]|uniref:Uncharacterized protein n=1 Tax=Clostridium tagluense TaxID=360422 RepID=A0A401UTR5_9CLOT|nr:hypothetical protein [Clostridium tagluense]GCD12904.1 hypothetical protein Ctaglu_45270 [Clostridium tagluense]
MNIINNRIKYLENEIKKEEKYKKKINIMIGALDFYTRYSDNVCFCGDSEYIEQLFSKKFPFAYNKIMSGSQYITKEDMELG